jgi:hypothetical protein
MVQNFRTTGSVLDKQKTWKLYLLTEGKLDDTGARMEIRPKNLWAGSLFKVGSQNPQLAGLQLLKLRL